MNRWICAATLLLWSALSAGTWSGDQPVLAVADASDVPSLALSPADELPDDLTAAQPPLSEQILDSEHVPDRRVPGEPHELAVQPRARSPPPQLPV